MLEAYVPASRHDTLLIAEYVNELWRRYHRVEPAERALIRRRLLRRRRTSGCDDAQQVQDLLAHNPAGLQDSVPGLQYVIDQLAAALVAVRGLAAADDLMQPLKDVSARLRDKVVSIRELVDKTFTKRHAIIAAIEGVQATLRQALAEQEMAADKLDDIETALCMLPASNSGENLLRHLRRSDRRLAQLRRMLEPLRRTRRDSAGERETPPAAGGLTV